MVSVDTNAEMRRLLERQRIWDCLLRYIRGVDRMDLTLIRSAFWPDATNSHGPVAGDVEDFIAGWFPAQATREVSWHMVSNQQYDFAEDGASAHVETYFTAGIRLTDDPQIEIVGGRYADRYEKRSDEWRIATRVVLLDWQGMADATGMTARKAKRHQGSRGGSDPTYERPLRSRDAIETPW
jgi:SnoaL-like domain